MKKKRVLAALLAGVMLFGTTGCMQKSGGDAGAQASVEAPEGPLEPYKETVTLTTILPENAGIQWQEGDSYDDNPWYRAYKDRLNIEVKNAWVSNDYNTKLNLTIADGDIPDVFFATSQQFQQLVEADLVWDLTEVFDKYASDDLKGYMELQPASFELAHRDGKLYAIPQLSYGIIDQPGQVWVRQDWAKEANVEDVKTVEDLENAAKAFKEKHGTYALAEDQNLTAFNILATGWGAHPKIWIEKEDGSIEYGSIQPEMKEALAQYAEWYKEGLLDPEFGQKDMEKMFQGLINGEVGICPMEQWFGYTPGVDIISEQGAQAEFDAYKVPSANGTEVKASIQEANYGFIVVSKKCANPEAAIKLVNFYAYMMDHAQEKEDPKFVDSLFNNAYNQIPYGVRVINPMTDYDQFTNVTAYLDKYLAGEEVDSSDLGKDAVKYEHCVQWIEEKDPVAIGDWFQQGSPKSAYRISKEMLDNEEYVKDATDGKDIPTIQSLGEVLNDILLEGFTKIIVGDKPVDYFDTLVKDWYTAGGEAATKEVNEMCK